MHWHDSPHRPNCKLMAIAMAPLMVRADHGFAPLFEGIGVSAADRFSALRRFIRHDWCEFAPNPPI